MELKIDWNMLRFILQIVNFAGIVAVFMFNKWSHDKITTNDLKHLADDISEIKNNQKEQGDNINALNTDVAYIKGMKENEDRVLKILESGLKK